jgi:hypothetical protein
MDAASVIDTPVSPKRGDVVPVRLGAAYRHRCDLS